MTATVPIYQMTFGQDSNGKPGLVFTSEQEEYGNQSLLFTIPVFNNFHHTMDFLDYLEHQKIYFPFQLGEKYYELPGKLNFPEIVFSIPETDIEITFEMDNDHNYGWNLYPFRRRPYRNMKYVGKHQNLFKENTGFIVVLPVDLYEMDELYLKYGGVFVGLTPNFGNLDNLRRQ